MSAQVKTKTENNTDKEIVDKPIDKRPNIDILIKRIVQQRRQERYTNLTMILIGVIIISIASFSFSQF
jgi:hypothetical protein